MIDRIDTAIINACYSPVSIRGVIRRVKIIFEDEMKKKPWLQVEIDHMVADRISALVFNKKLTPMDGGTYFSKEAYRKYENGELNGID
jgi:hypothetical protein